MTDERMREVFAESAAITLGQLAKDGDRKQLEKYAETIKRVAIDMDRNKKRRIAECPR